MSVLLLLRIANLVVFSLCILIRMPQVRRKCKCLVYIYIMWGCGRVLASSKVWWSSVKSSSVCGVTTGAVAMNYNTRVGRLGQQKRLVIERRARESVTRANADTGILLLSRVTALVWPKRSRRRSYEAKILGSSPSTSFLDGNKKANFRNSAIAARTRKRRLSTQLAGLRAGCLQQSTNHLRKTRGSPTVKIVGCLGRYQATSGSPATRAGQSATRLIRKRPRGNPEPGTRHPVFVGYRIRASSGFRTSSRAAG